jgi:L-iditol 2-dehydrogenase
LEGYNRLVYTDVPEPAVGPDDVLVRVEACGICGSDIHGIDGSSGRRIPPVIMGHEAAGVIAEVGRRVKTWHAGDRVTFDSTIYCGGCSFCQQGRINLCENRRVLGVSCPDYRQDGAFADYVAVPQHIVYRLPGALSFEQATMIEALSIAFHAVGRTSLRPDDTVVVIGVGMIGLLVVQLLRAAGGCRIIAVDLDQRRLDLACRLGASEGLHADAIDVAQRVLKMTQGRGADLAFEVVGVEPTVGLAVQCLRKGGTVTLVGNLSPTVSFPLQSVVTREIALFGSCASSGEYPACLDMVERGIIDVDALISAVAPLAEGATWFQRLYEGEPGLMKVILKP